MKMNPVRIGAAVPPEASAKGALNETIPLEDRNPVTPEKLDEGPKKTATGAFLPGAYKLANGNTRMDR